MLSPSGSSISVFDFPFGSLRVLPLPQTRASWRSSRTPSVAPTSTGRFRDVSVMESRRPEREISCGDDRGAPPERPRRRGPLSTRRDPSTPLDTTPAFTLDRNLLDRQICPILYVELGANQTELGWLHSWLQSAQVAEEPLGRLHFRTTRAGPLEFEEVGACRNHVQAVPNL